MKFSRLQGGWNPRIERSPGIRCLAPYPVSYHGPQNLRVEKAMVVFTSVFTPVCLTHACNLSIKRTHFGRSFEWNWIRGKNPNVSHREIKLIGLSCTSCSAQILAKRCKIDCKNQYHWMSFHFYSCTSIFFHFHMWVDSGCSVFPPKWVAIIACGKAINSKVGFHVHVRYSR